MIITEALQRKDNGKWQAVTTSDEDSSMFDEHVCLKHKEGHDTPAEAMECFGKVRKDSKMLARIMEGEE